MSVDPSSTVLVHPNFCLRFTVWSRSDAGAEVILAHTVVLVVNLLTFLPSLLRQIIGLFGIIEYRCWLACFLSILMLRCACDMPVLLLSSDFGLFIVSVNFACFFDWRGLFAITNQPLKSNFGGLRSTTRKSACHSRRARIDPIANSCRYIRRSGQGTVSHGNDSGGQSACRCSERIARRSTLERADADLLHHLIGLVPDLLRDFRHHFGGLFHSIHHGDG